MPKKTKMIKKDTMQDIIDSGLQGINKTDDILARLWRLLLYESNMQLHIWDSLLTKWQTRLMKSYTLKGAACKKGNITRELANHKISWGKFIVALTILGYDSMNIELTLYRKGKARTLKIFVADLIAEADNDELLSDNKDKDTEGN